MRLEEIASGFGFPSGHVMGMTLFAGALVCLVWQTNPRRRTRLAAVSSAGVVLLASGFGRIAVGAHWPSDVLGGYLWAGLGVAGLAWCRQTDAGVVLVRMVRERTARRLGAPGSDAEPQNRLPRRNLAAAAIPASGANSGRQRPAAE